MMKAYIWDLDGTLLDSYGSIVSSLESVSRECGAEDRREEILTMVKRESVSAYLRGLAERTGKEQARLYSRYREISHGRMDEISLIPGAAETLEALRAAGARHFVYTHRGQSAGPLLERLGLTAFFEEIVTFEYGLQPKPSGDGVRYLADRYGLDRAETAYVGDRPLDVACAVDAGVTAVLFLPEGSCVKPSGEEDLVIRSLAELTEEMPASRIRMLEKLAAHAHAALETAEYDGWLLRFSEGYTGRANSVSVLYPSEVSPEEKIAFCEESYRARNLPCVFKLTDADAGLGAFLEKRGYRPEKPTDVMVKDLHGETPPEGQVLLSDRPGEEWLRCYFGFEGLENEKNREIYRRMLAKMEIGACYAAAVRDGRIAACASSAAEKGWILIQNVVADPEHRRQGFGRTVCRALLAEAERTGARHACLQVVQNNPAAIRLYEGLGFRKAYTYRYFRKEMR